MGVPKWLKQKKKQTHKQTKTKKNKQIYKQTHIFRSYISEPNQVGSSQNFEGIFLWVSQDD